MKKIYGEAAKTNYDAAMRAVREGRIADARAIELQPGDRVLVEREIARVKVEPDGFPSPY